MRKNTKSVTFPIYYTVFKVLAEPEFFAPTLANNRGTNYNFSAWWKSTSRFTLFTAGVAQLAEHDVANVVVEGSNPFARF